jgi:hypothetical protein
VEGMSELQQLIRKAAHEAGGYRTLARRSRGAVSHSTLNNLATGRHSGRLKPIQLSGVAAAIGRPAPEVARLLGLAYADPGRPFVLPERANALTPQQRRAVLTIIDVILTAGEASRGGPGTMSQEEWASKQIARERRLAKDGRGSTGTPTAVAERPKRRLT